MSKILAEKLHGDAKRIFSIYKKKCENKGETPLSYGSVRSMLNGNRTMSADVKEVANSFYEKLQTI